LDYYTTQGDSYLLGPSTITGKENFIYTENGYYNSKKNIGNFKRKSYIKYKDRLIEGDSLYYDRKKEFASGTHNVKITDSIKRNTISVEKYVPDPREGPVWRNTGMTTIHKVMFWHM
jgi:hypothetical protein